jgi:hypothetical protein
MVDYVFEPHNNISEEAVEKFSLALLDVINDAFPKVTIRRRHDDPIWMTTRVKILMNMKDKYFRRKNFQKFLCARENLRK